MVVLLRLRGVPSGSIRVADGRGSFSLTASRVPSRTGPPLTGHPAVVPWAAPVSGRPWAVPQGTWEHSRLPSVCSLSLAKCPEEGLLGHPAALLGSKARPHCFPVWRFLLSGPEGRRQVSSTAALTLGDVSFSKRGSLACHGWRWAAPSLPVLVHKVLLAHGHCLLHVPSVATSALREQVRATVRRTCSAGSPRK